MNALEIERQAAMRGPHQIEYIGEGPELRPPPAHVVDSIHRSALRHQCILRKQEARNAGPTGCFDWLRTQLKWIKAIGHPDFHEVLGIRLAPLSYRHLLVRIQAGEVLVPFLPSFEATCAYQHILDTLEL